MPDQASGGVKVTLDGAHVRVDARPARLVSLLTGATGVPLVTAQGATGEGHTEALPEAARQATFHVSEDVTVEATSAANFVAVAEERGRCVVVAYGGEVTVIPAGGDRFALAANEALVIGDDGSPTVVPASELSDTTHPGVAAMIDAAADALLPTPAPAPTAKPAPASKTAENVQKPAAKSETTQPVAKVAKASAKSAGGNRRKKGKKRRPQPAKAANGAPTAAAAAVAGRPPTKPSGNPPGKRPAAGESADEPQDDSQRDKRLLILAVVVGLVMAVIAVVLLSNTDDTTDVATGRDETTSTTALTTTTGLTTTTTPATTTTALTTTTGAPAQPAYAVEPRSCVQSDNSITYTASITNRSDAAFDYEIDVSFTTSDGTEVAKATATARDVAPSRTAAFTATGTSDRNLAGTGASCNVTRVHPTPSS